MVARITFGKHIAGVLLYNKLKIDRQAASVMLCHNLPLMPRDGKIDLYRLCEAFQPHLSHPRSGLGEPVFHASLNPDPNDRLDDMQLLEIAHSYMEKMGYGDQPFVVFKHQDIQRTHLHIVSSRIQPDGRPVDYYKYKERSVAATKAIEQEYGLRPAIPGQERYKFEELRKVVYAEGNVKAQMTSVVRNLMDRYRVGSVGELNTLLGLYNISVEECRGEVAGRAYAGMIYGALDDEGRRVGKPIKASRIGRDVGYKALQKEYAKTKKWIKENTRKLAPSRSVIREAMRSHRTAEAFAAAIRHAGLSVVFHRSAQHSGRIYGVTFIDHHNRIVINGSKLDKSFSANHFQELFTAQAAEQVPLPDPTLHTPANEVQTEQIEQEQGAQERPYEPQTEQSSGFRDMSPDGDLLSDLLDEAARPEQWEEWFRTQKKKKRRYRPK